MKIRNKYLDSSESVVKFLDFVDVFWRDFNEECFRLRVLCGVQIVEVRCECL